ncbi:hypothetical protein ISN45_At02g021360 [Arabidopsis thaliana x Arabidopsis arenosa]|uniref:Transmembrane protein n=3 Tax=Arabidopsis TaxID=3701 RepID=Q9XIN4_ARATH|nr:uncharacterized protein AT2G27270 [Arabidopsis thaliana]KAG7637632.1 hypothetical protein ISN45_At02g021360 [Arabidopsis thaliana x Arabidopsis arenosa]AAD42002.1 hypothetical protein [Arabidopsis thaliana]AAO11659.1 hypothetical protein [Arabidopsis thaliana]AAT69179.1 hypothetical protein At2g27270 [Arabidopsis thaliana]AEC07966.1 transmembrane protein [Arabidopsis thaliana]|eukprot:NP_180295.1 transmembrane protein [Arabidopsis thaliana]
MQKKDEATMKKNGPTTKREEPTKKKTEAKEEGAAASKHSRVVYSDKSRCLSKNGKTIIYFGVPAALILLIICVFAFNYIAIQPRVPRFMLEDLYVDPLSNTSVIVKLSSTNPSYKSSVYYRKISLHVLVGEKFETESVFLQSRRQEPRTVRLWTAVIANNNDNGKPTGAFLVRHGMYYGHVIADIVFQWKSGIFSFKEFGLHVRCPVLLRLEDLSSATIRAGSTCSQHFHL